ncbi:MAG: histidine--tRNA ligase, partial [Endomicrobiia bacterium]
MEIKSIRGVRDLLPEDVEKLRYVEKTCREIVEKYGFKEIIIPTIENVLLYQHSVGETSDVVTKQMFEVVNKDKKDNKNVVLRPEGTAGVVRAFVEHNFKDKYPVKRFFYFGSMFRYERPQKGRFREFYQFGIEIFNEFSISSDLLLIKIIDEIFQNLKLEVVLEINTIGCQECRKEFVNILKEKIKNLQLQLCNLCNERLQKNPLRIFDCKVDLPKLKEKLNDFNIQNYLCEKCNVSFKQILEGLEKQKIIYTINPMLVRGLDYYNGFVFEYKTKLLDAAQNTLCAGGRYDGLIEKFLSEEIPACGAAFGIDRIIEVVKVPQKESLKVGIGIVNETFLLKAFEILKMLSSKNKDIIFLGPFSKKSLKSQMRLFNNENCKYVLLVGEEI